MSVKDVFAQINIASPCTADWDSMIGNDQIRFCQHCRLSVHDLSQMSSKEFKRLVAKSEGRLCVRYSRANYATPNPVRVFHQIKRRTSLLVASAFTAGLSLSTAVASRVQVNPADSAGGNKVAFAVETKDALIGQGATIKGTIYDPNGAVISGATVVVSNPDSGAVLRAISNGQGEYNFDGLEAGVYNLKIEAPGFATSDIPNIVLRANEENRFDQTMSIASIQVELNVISATTMGMVIMTASEPLVKAAEDDDMDAIREALLAKPDANVRDPRTNWSALEIAVRHANREIMQELLWAKADVNARDRSGQTVLMMLGEKVTTDIVWDLINNGAKVNLRDNDGDTALIAIAQQNNVEVLKVLLAAGARVNARNNDGQTALMRAASEGLINNLKLLLLAGGDINARDNQGKTAFIYASENDHSHVVRLLRSSGADESDQTKKQ